MFNELKKELIPFVILEAHPDNKKPYILPYYGMIEEYKLKDTLLEKLVDFVYDNIDIDNLNSVEDIEKYWKNFYSDCYMDNPPWQATAIINGIWEDIYLSNEELFNVLIIKKMKNINYISSETDDKSESSRSDKTVESIIINDSNDDNELLMEKLDYEV